MRINGRHGIFTFVSLFILLFDSLFVIANYIFSKETLLAELTTEAQGLHRVFHAAQKDTEKNLILTASVFANDAQIQALFFQAKQALEREGGGSGGEETARLRQQLYALIEPRWNQAMTQLGARQLHFHFGPGSLSFLRVHRPEKYGDRMDNVRFTIVDTHAEGKPRSGFETGRVYSGIRGAVPVWHASPTGERELIGVLETGVAFDSLISSFSHATNTEVSILLTREHIQSAMWPHAIKRRFGAQKTPCGCVVEASSRPVENALLAKVARTGDGGFLKDGVSRIIYLPEGRYYSTTFYPLRDYLGQKQAQRPDVGAILLWQDVSERMDNFYATQRFNLIYAALAYILIEILLFFGFRRVTRHMELEIQRKTRALADREQRLRTLLDAAPEAMLLTDATGRIVMLNQRAEQLFGYRREELLGQVLDRLLPLRFRAPYHRQLKWLLEQEENRATRFAEAEQNISGCHKNGTEIPLEVTFSLLESEQGVQIITTLHDISEHLSYERALLQAKEAAEAASRAKSAFLANVSHELRTPLNTVLGFAQILNNSGVLPAAQQRYTQAIQRGGDYLLTLVNDILDLAKIEAGRFELFPQIWLTAHFFQELAGLYAMQAEQKGLIFHYCPAADLPRAVYSDHKRLRQVLTNLLANAIKFTEYGSITLRVVYQSGELHIQVEDTGIGIAEDQLEQIFEPFSQVGKEHYKSQGTGLGLAISRRLIESMKGRLDIHSQPEQGTQFHLHVPAEAVSTVVEALPGNEQQAVTGYQREDGSAPFRVLIADDISDNRSVLRGLLEPLGFMIAEVENGQRCLTVSAAWLPDIILLDLRMPGLDGLETTRLLRTQPDLRHLPIVAITASAFSTTREKALEAGCNAHIAKPIHWRELLYCLADLLPLQWTYAETAAQRVLRPEEDADELSAAQLHHLRELLDNGDISALISVAETLIADNCCPVLAEKIHSLAEGFYLPELDKLFATLQARKQREK